MLVLVLSITLAVATGLILSSPLADGSVTQWLVGAYVIVFAEIVVVSLLLSLGSVLTRWVLFGTLAGVFLLALPVAQNRRFPPLGPAARVLLGALREPVILAVAVVVVGVIGYSVALGLFIPPNDGDAIGYHLARAAFWRQQDAIGYVHGAADQRLNGFLPNGEIAMAFTMITSGSGRFAPLVQLTAAIATSFALYGIGRRIGLDTRAALFGAFLFLTLPAVALQSSTGLNDIVVASFVGCSAFFLLGSTPGNLVPTALAVALLVGTKITCILALPALVLIAMATRRQKRILTLSALAIGIVVGAYWYFVNLAKAGDPAGGNETSGLSGDRAGFDAIASIGRVLRLGLAAIESPGAIGLDRLLYVAAAALLVIVAFKTSGSSRQRATRAAIAAAGTLIPLSFAPIERLLLRGDQKLFFELGRPDVGYLDSARSITKASPLFSWYGPLGVLLTGLSCALVFRAIRRKELPWITSAFAAAPALWVVLLGILVPYYEWNGRHAMGGFALAAATWGVALRTPPLAWASAAVALLTSALAFVHLHDRPSGLRLLEPATEHSVWTEPSWVVQATDHPHLRVLLRFVDNQVPSNATLALEPNVYPGGTHTGGELPPFPFFGSHLSRRIVFADSPESAREARAQWAILRDDGIGRCVSGWQGVLRYDVWIVLRRAPTSRCM